MLYPTELIGLNLSKSSACYQNYLHLVTEIDILVMLPSRDAFKTTHPDNLVII